MEKYNFFLLGLFFLLISGCGLIPGGDSTESKETDPVQARIDSVKMYYAFKDSLEKVNVEIANLQTRINNVNDSLTLLKAELKAKEEAWVPRLYASRIAELKALIGKLEQNRSAYETDKMNSEDRKRRYESEFAKYQSAGS